MKSLVNSLARSISTLVAACAATLLLAHCGGVGEDGSGAAPPDTYSTGVVNGFGSVVVNGVHFDVSRAEIVLDGVTGKSQSDLSVGMVVAVAGTLAADGSTGTATRLVYESLLRGDIDSLPGANTMQVLGQSVVVDESTLFAGASALADLQIADRVQVSGFRAPDGSLRATWVARVSGGDLQLTAFIESVTGSTVHLAGLDINIAGTGVAPATLAPGQLVRVALQAAPVGGAAVATKLGFVDRRGSDSLVKQQLQGLVAQWNPGTGTFSLNGQPVRVNAATRYDDGATASNLANGVRIQLKGTLAQGVVTADRVRIVPTRLTGYGRGRVTSIDAGNLRFSLLDLPGVEVRIRAETLLNDNTIGGGVLNLANLAIGDEIAALGRANGDRIDAEVVTRLPRATPGTGVGGPARLTATTTLSILGTDVEVNGANFSDAQGNPMSQSTFLATLQQDDLVRAEGVYALGTLRATSVRFAR